jgi:hypothetical protein
VLRPANPHSPDIHRFLRALREAGFDGASEPVGIEDGRERLVFIDGDVALPPYPAWVQADEVLASLAVLLRRFHDASRAFDPTGSSWSDEVADPLGGGVVGHNDVCIENVVFRDGVAVGLLDFDYAAPGRPLWDLGQMARMCTPIDDPQSASMIGWHPNDAPGRLRLVADAYGLDAEGRAELLDVVRVGVDRSGEFVRRHVEAGEPGFVMMWDWFGGQERWDRRRRWWALEEGAFSAALS